MNQRYYLIIVQLRRNNSHRKR